MVIEFNKISKRVTKDILFLLLFKVNFLFTRSMKDWYDRLFFFTDPI